MYNKEEGIKAIIDLQAFAGITESKERAAEAWDNMKQHERDVTEAFHLELVKKQSVQAERAESQASRVRNLVMHCFYDNDEIKDLAPGTTPAGAIIVKGITKTLGFKPERVKINEASIKALIEEIVPDDFLTTGGKGMSFLNLCMNRRGEHWAEHPVMEELILLGMAIKRAGFCVPREMWSMFPGGMPYVWFDTRTDDEIGRSSEILKGIGDARESGG